MSFKLSALSLFAIGALFIDGAMAQPSAAPICAESTQKNLNTSLISVRLSEQGSSVLVAATTNTEDNVTECKIVKSGGMRADKTACIWVKDHWRSLKRCQQP